MPRYLSVTPRLPVRDLSRTIGFYHEALGLQVGSLWPEDGPTFVILERDTLRLQFYTCGPGATGADQPVIGEATLNLDVDDARALHQSLGGRVAVEWGPEVYWYGRREFAIRDPDGYLLIVSEETDDPPTCQEG
jgi:catechol 2,3-dioxygenase-like lactoylglutathione lyase family enzyme